MTVRYHVTPSGDLDHCYAKAEPCPCREHHDFFNDDSAIAWKIAAQLSAVDPSNRRPASRSRSSRSRSLCRLGA